MSKGRRKGNRIAKNHGANLGFEEKLWAAADKLRGHMDAAEYSYEERSPAPGRASSVTGCASHGV